MNKHLSPDVIRQLPVAERLKLIEELWDSLEGESNALPLADWQRKELDERIAAHAADPDAAWPWSDVKPEILGNLRK